MLTEDSIPTETQLRRPRLLLLHGVMSTHAVWEKLRAELNGDATMLAPDLLGYGRATMPNGRYSLDDVVEHLGPIVERFRPTHVLGYSMGGIVALGVRARFGEMLAGVGIIGLPVYQDMAEGRIFLSQRGPVVTGFLRNHHISHLGCEVARLTGPLWHPIAHWQMPMRPKATLDALFRHCSAAHHGAMTELIFSGHVPGLAQANGPRVAAIHGTMDNAAPLDAARMLAERFGWDFTVVEGETHQLPLERPDIVADWVRKDVLTAERMPIMR